MTDNAQPIIQTEKLCKTFTQGSLQTPVLFDIDLTIHSGEFVALMGPSGCGKSTLMHILGQMLPASSGAVRLHGQETTCLSAHARSAIRREKLGFVFQRFNLLGTLSVYDNLAMAERLRGQAVDGQVRSALEAVGMWDKAKVKPGRLSMGQQQRVAIARAISHKPALLLADEPTGNLDSKNTDQVLELFRQIHQQYGTTILMITHSTHAAQAADHILEMEDGRIVGH